MKLYHLQEKGWKGIMLNEISQAQKGKCSMFSLTCGEHGGDGGDVNGT
jgi:hypothetical protein